MSAGEVTGTSSLLGFFLVFPCSVLSGDSEQCRGSSSSLLGTEVQEVVSGANAPWRCCCPSEERVAASQRVLCGGGRDRLLRPLRLKMLAPEGRTFLRWKLGNRISKWNYFPLVTQIHSLDKGPLAQKVLLGQWLHVTEHGDLWGLLGTQCGGAGMGGTSSKLRGGAGVSPEREGVQGRPALSPRPGKLQVSA